MCEKCNAVLSIPDQLCWYGRGLRYIYESQQAQYRQREKENTKLFIQDMVKHLLNQLDWITSTDSRIKSLKSRVWPILLNLLI